ncbi:MAG: dynamin family protein [Trinickia sp.]|uniref:dynamin family protein n=1 Tax=Trinickia sp. TaxID=2571163 RepID=UPI003F80C657
MKKNVKQRTIRSSHVNQSAINKRTAGRKIARLKEHLRQLESLEVVLTVVGTMKAGKSTCINAIVGREILPSRNRPMTAIPTLVRHKPGAQVPVLLFSNAEPAQKLTGSLRRALARASAVRRARVESDPELSRLATRIARGFSVKPRYRGDAAVLSFLQSLNDLARLAEIFNIEFPFEQYSGLADFPLIEIEFANLGRYDDLGQRGRLALLDTPGFNESRRSPHLRAMFQERLQDANAVLAVLDYTQLKSEAEAELMTELQGIARHAEGRMFALVNRFDCKDHNSDTAEATGHYVSSKLLDGVVRPERIFSVSAKQAYLAQRAQAALDASNGEGGLRWVEGKRLDWRDDFGAQVFGRRYGTSLNNSEEVRQGIAQLWEASRFVAPLHDVIHFSQVEAVKFALGSSLDQLAALAEYLEDA